MYDSLQEPGESFVEGRAAYAADILALSRAALDAMHRTLRSAPEVRENRVMTRWPLDVEDILFALEPIAAETPMVDLAARLRVSPSQVRSTALRLQRMSLVRVSETGVSLSVQGRQKLARIEMARSAVLRRIAEGIEAPLTEADARQVIRFLQLLLERTEAVLESQVQEV